MTDNYRDFHAGSAARKDDQSGRIAIVHFILNATWRIEWW
jgi:hypothetical protein